MATFSEYKFPRSLNLLIILNCKFFIRLYIFFFLLSERETHWILWWALSWMSIRIYICLCMKTGIFICLWVRVPVDRAAEEEKKTVIDDDVDAVSVALSFLHEFNIFFSVFLYFCETI